MTRHGESHADAPARNGSVLSISEELLQHTFETLRHCGSGRHECQVLWIGPWQEPDVVSRVVHPQHRSHGFGFQLDDDWITRFWLDLARERLGVRAQVHTHPAEAFHSWTDDEYPIIRTAGFLSLVIPNFAQGEIGLAGTFLTEVQPDGEWKEVDPNARLRLT